MSRGSGPGPYWSAKRMWRIGNFTLVQAAEDADQRSRECLVDDELTGRRLPVPPVVPHGEQPKVGQRNGAARTPEAAFQLLALLSGQLHGETLEARIGRSLDGEGNEREGEQARHADATVAARYALRS